MKRFLTAFLLLTAMTVSLPSCVIALGNTGGTGCPECEHCQQNGEFSHGSFDFDSYAEEHIEADHEG